MARGRKKLKPDIKAQRRQEALQRYAENVRARIQASGPAAVRAHREQACQTAALYRDRNRDAIRIVDVQKRARKYIEKEGLEAFDEKTQHRSMSETQRRHEGRPPPLRPPTLPKKATRRMPPSPLDSDGDDADDEEDERDDALTQTLPSLHPRVLPERVIPERALPKWPTANLPPAQSLPPCACGEDGCCGCACICPASKIWKLHGGHYKTSRFMYGY
ncbi:hypothetical protein C8R43DRAFT_949454 [Mycena crocata]|nr:hypothetical protein C8R43DRAFT_966180 [Mycena crocata]KAJ7156609.1 hypothetical protein C8R43DRAFT_949454 [Mycena crocata]